MAQCNWLSMDIQDWFRTGEPKLDEHYETWIYFLFPPEEGDDKFYQGILW